MGFFGTFRGRLLVILAFLIIATLGVQYYVNILTQRQNEAERNAQAQALVEGFKLGAYGVTATERLQEILENDGDRFLSPESRTRVRDIINIDNNWRISDSLSGKYLPVSEENGELVYKRLDDLTDLPPLIEAQGLGDDLTHFPNRKSAGNKDLDDEARALPIETSEGRWYVMVLLRNDKGEAAKRAAQPLLATLGILLISTLIMLVFVWRFTRPIANLSNAAREIAAGNLSVRIPQTDRSDEISRLAQNFNEMTAELEKKQELEGKLQQAEKSAVIGRLGSAIAHEIRNPLNYINLTLDHLRSRYAPDNLEKREAFDKLTLQLKSEVARINQQITDFLNYSRPATADLRPIDARQVVEDSLRIVEAQAAENDIKIAVIEHEDVPQLMGDPEFLRSVFNNLFINAVQAMGSNGGHLNVKIQPDDGNVRFEVSDTGNGIPGENLSKIFEPYFSTKETGTGLGLAIVQKIVDIHNGTIGVESTVGEGTKFTVRIPKAD